MRFKADVPEISKHTGFNVTGYLAGFDVHRSGVDSDSGVNSVVHRLIRSGIKSDFRAQIFRGQSDVHACIIGAMSHDLLLIVLQDFRIVADAFDEQNAITELTGEVIVNLRALRSRDQHSVQELEIGKALDNNDAIS